MTVTKVSFLVLLLLSAFPRDTVGTESQPNIEMGTAIADLLKNDLAGKSEAFSKAFQDGLASAQQGFVNPEVTKVQDAANKLAAQMQQMPQPDPLCTRDYTKPCPEGWTHMGGSACKAPKTYGGSCENSASFQGYSPLQKSKYAQECVAPWPCFGECSEGRDYDQVCPAGWTELAGGICNAPASYAGSCMKQYKFDTYTLEKKEQVAHACGFQWPCQTPCVRDYSSACPEEWTELSFSPGMCQAPPTYMGECPFGADMKGVTTEQKQAFEVKCTVKWPCQKSGAMLQSGAESPPRSGSLSLAAVRSKTMSDEGSPNMPVVNLHVAEAASGILEERRAAEEGRARRHKLAELEEKALRNKEMFSQVLASMNRQIEKLVDLAAGTQSRMV